MKICFEAYRVGEKQNLVPWELDVLILQASSMVRCYHWRVPIRDPATLPPHHNQLAQCGSAVSVASWCWERFQQGAWMKTLRKTYRTSKLYTDCCFVRIFDFSQEFNRFCSSEKMWSNVVDSFISCLPSTFIITFEDRFLRLQKPRSYDNHCT